MTRRFEDLFCIRKGVWLYDSASVAAMTRHFENFSDLKVCDLRTVNCIRDETLQVTLTAGNRARSLLYLVVWFQSPVQCMNYQPWLAGGTASS
jgi:hypothetical protein